MSERSAEEVRIAVRRRLVCIAAAAYACGLLAVPVNAMLYGRFEVTEAQQLASISLVTSVLAPALLAAVLAFLAAERVRLGPAASAPREALIGRRAAAAVSVMTGIVPVLYLTIGIPQVDDLVRAYRTHFYVAVGAGVVAYYALHRFTVRGGQDVFISHASEDKDTVARPLAESLRSEGYRVWYDEHTLSVGDTLRREIDKGLVRCRYGVVVLSPSFFRKEWPQEELDRLLAQEAGWRVKRVLPIWHDVDEAALRGYSEALAGRLGLRWSRGLPEVVRELKKVLGPPGSAPPPGPAPPALPQAARAAPRPKGDDRAGSATGGDVVVPSSDA